MRYSINSNSTQRAYLQIYQQIRNDIINSVYKYGDKLPSKRILADETMTSVITIEHAYEILCDEGYAQSKERVGYFVTYREKDFVPVAEINNITHTINHNYHHIDEGFPFSVFAKTMRNVISVYGEQILVKSNNSGCDELRQAIADYLARGKGIKVLPEQIIIGSGAEYLYGLIVQFLGRDRVYGIENPSYEKIYSVYKANGAQCDLLTLGSDGILASELVRTKSSVLHITPFRSFPSGITASASKRNEYVQWAAKGNRIIIEDDFDSEFTVSRKNEDTVFSLEPNRSVIYVNTFTKTLAPSMRIGYMVLPKELVNAFSGKMGFYSCTVPVFEQYVLAELLNNGNFERHINRIRRKRRLALKDKNYNIM